GGFTITNLGGIGGTSFTPVVNWPEVAILGISRGAYQPVWNGSAFEPRLMLPLSLSYDHRVIDGADAARFLRWVAEAFEQPLVMALYRRPASSHVRFHTACRHWGRTRRVRRGVLRGRPRHEGRARRSRAEPGRGLPVPRMHPVQSAPA